MALSLGATLCLAAFLHPYFTYPLSLKLFRARPVAEKTEESCFSASTMFAAHNEEQSLPEKIRNLREIRKLHPELEVLAYSDMSTDRTLELLREADDVLITLPATRRTGKATGMRIMVAEAHGDICIFTDANVIVKPSSISRLLSYFSDPEVGGVAGSLVYINEGETPTARAGGLYWRLEEIVKKLESRCGSIMGADGSIFATRREFYPEVPPHLLDDMTVSMSVLCHGKRLIHASDVIAYERNVTASTDEFQRKRRIACRAYNTHLHLYPKLRACFEPLDFYKYFSHKILRWFGLVFLGAAFIFGGLAILASGHQILLLWLTTAIFTAYFLGSAGLPLLSTFVEIFRSITATFLGIIDAWRGRTYQTWVPAKSR